MSTGRHECDTNTQPKKKVLSGARTCYGEAESRVMMHVSQQNRVSSGRSRPAPIPRTTPDGITVGVAGLPRL